MADKAQQIPPEIITTDEMSSESKKKPSFFRLYKWWVQITIYSIFIIGGLSAGTLLGRVYYDNGAKSNWMATVVVVAGFPPLIPFQFFTSNTNPITIPLAAFYAAIGVFSAVNAMLYSVGLQYLPVTTYNLICATQLAFNAVFSFFLNRQKFTPYIINSVVLLTISSTLLVFHRDAGGATQSKKKTAIGFVCTVAASGGDALMLSLTQVAFKKLIKKETVRAIVDLAVYQNLVSTVVLMMGLFGSGDWRRIKGEMEGFKLGKVSYVMNLVWTAVSWQVFGVGCIGLIFKSSSLFTNVISVLGLPVAPVMAVVFLGERLTGLKAVSMVVAVWGFVSYIYQHYLDDLERKRKERGEESAASGVSSN